MYHVGRPGEDGYAERVLQAWGVDGHNSHTNVCSAAARLGYTLWTGADQRDFAGFLQRIDLAVNFFKLFIMNSQELFSNQQNIWFII